MKGFKIGVLMLVVVSAVTIGGIGANAAVISNQNTDVATRIAYLLAQIRWLQEQLLILQSGLNNPTNTVAVGSEFSLQVGRTVTLSGSNLTIKNYHQIECFVAPCPMTFNILVQESGYADKYVLVG